MLVASMTTKKGNDAFIVMLNTEKEVLMSELTAGDTGEVKKEEDGKDEEREGG